MDHIGDRISPNHMHRISADDRVAFYFAFYNCAKKTPTITLFESCQQLQQRSADSHTTTPHYTPAVMSIDIAQRPKTFDYLLLRILRILPASLMPLIAVPFHVLNGSRSF